MLGRSVLHFLENLGCCQRCTLIFLGERSDVLYTSAAGLTQAIEDAVNQVFQADDGVSKNDNTADILCMILLAYSCNNMSNSKIHY